MTIADVIQAFLTAFLSFLGGFFAPILEAIRGVVG